jgi:RND family efflux transporter MFP subunit
LIGKDKAQANLEAATAQLKSQKIRLEQTNIVAVDDGVISSRSATLGSVVQVGTELFRLVRQNRIEWRAEVVADQVFNINSGQEAHIHLTSGESIVGKVRVTAPTFDTKTRKTLVYVDLPADTSARVGMFARGDILVGTNEVMTLPQSAVVLRYGYSYVFEIGSNQRVVQNKIVTGRRVDNRVEIVSGLNQNMSVVAGGGAFLNDGDTVYIADVATDSSLQVTE